VIIETLTFAHRSPIFLVVVDFSRTWFRTGGSPAMTALRQKKWQPTVSERAIPHVRTFLGQRLRILRKRLHVSQTVLGKRSRLSGKFIGEVERGEKSISIDSLYRVSVALGVPLYLLTDVGRSRNSVPSRDAERVLALVVDGPRPSIRRAYAILQTMFGTDQPATPRKTAARRRPSSLPA
jgi:transcriptional regulator with XRE-family HTH domain